MLRTLLRRGLGRELLLATHGQGPPPAAASLLLAARWQHGQGFDVREEQLSGKLGADLTSAVASSASDGTGGAAAAAAPAPAPVDGAGAAGTDESSLKLSASQLSPETFSSLADVCIGGLWTKIERGLREAAGEELEYQVLPDRHQICVVLPYDGKLCIKKDVAQRALVVESNLFEPWQDKDEKEFRPVSELEWDDEDGDTLPQFVSEALSQYLKKKVEVRL